MHLDVSGFIGSIPHMTAAMTSAPWVPTDTFGMRLVMVRAQKGLSQEEAAARCGLKASTWATWEKPNGAKPRGLEEVIRKISSGLGVDRGWLMFGGPLHDYAPDDRDPNTGEVDRRGHLDLREPRDTWIAPVLPMVA